LIVEHGEPLAGGQHRDGMTPDKLTQVPHRQKAVFLGNLLDRLARHRGRASERRWWSADATISESFPGGNPIPKIFYFERLRDLLRQINLAYYRFVTAHFRKCTADEAVMVTDHPASIVAGLHLEFFLIKDVPVKAGEFFGPCLIGLGNSSDWITGYWNGIAWYGDDGYVLLNPVVGALLPPLSRPP
jgi:hypothetical protein